MLDVYVVVCPHCSEVRETANFSGTYWEEGTIRGSVGLSRHGFEDHEEDDREYDRGDTDNYAYYCEQCDAEISEEDIFIKDSPEYFEALGEDAPAERMADNE